MTILMKTSICGKMVNFFFRMCFSSFHPKLYLLWPTFFTAFAFFLIFFLLFFISFCQSCIHKQKMPLIWRIFFSLMFFTAWPIRPKLIESLHFIIFGILLRSLIIVQSLITVQDDKFSIIDKRTGARNLHKIGGWQ